MCPAFEPDYFPRTINRRVPNLRYAGDVDLEGPYHINFKTDSKTVLAAKSATFFLSSGALTTGVAATFTLTTTPAISNSGIEPAHYGRVPQVVASAASTRTVTISGYDYLGQRLVAQVTLNGTTPVNFLSAFKTIDTIAIGASADTVTVSVGQSDILGLPYRSNGVLYGVVLNDGAPTGNGTLVAGLADATTPTNATADTRGTWTPNAADIPNGSRDLTLIYDPDRGNLHGVAPFGG